MSILVTELIDNGVMVAVPGAMNAGPGQLLFRVSPAASPVPAFLVTVPVNRRLIGRGLGHAVVHVYHRPTRKGPAAAPRRGPSRALSGRSRRCWR
ncbi:DUF4396 domain-containing protein [Kitasatospora griseola]|uniref:DUF4396 domain-containing protein n=1 Tax=Kitasatospora griseola TaxID=2064 RepID=UPI0037F863D6